MYFARRPTEDDLVEVAAGSGTRSTLSRRGLLIGRLQVIAKDIADSDRVARGSGSWCIVAFKDTQ